VNNLELVEAFFANAPEDFGAVIHDPDWRRAAERGIAPLLAPGFEFVTVQQSLGLPGPRRGIEGFFAAYTAYSETWTSFGLELRRIVEIGDRVLTEVRLQGITRTGGVPLEQDVAAVYTFEDGRILRVEEFSDVASAYEAVAAASES
jgi:ketosteroid isomerase-like protein